MRNAHCASLIVLRQAFFCEEGAPGRVPQLVAALINLGVTSDAAGSEEGRLSGQFTTTAPSQSVSGSISAGNLQPRQLIHRSLMRAVNDNG
jgi:hypothetical protein